MTNRDEIQNFSPLEIRFANCFRQIFHVLRQNFQASNFISI